MTSLSSSQQTFPSASSDSETYSSTSPQPADSSSPEPNSDETSSSPLILYSPPTFWSILRGAAINLFLPFVNGLMLGLGELVAHEAAWRLGWGGTKVFPSHRNAGGGAPARPVGPGVVMKEDITERKRRTGEEMDALTAME